MTVGVTSTLHASGNLGAVQGDASRNITGGFVADIQSDANVDKGFGTFKDEGARGHGDTGNDLDGGELREFSFDASRVVPTASEFRPANTAVRYLMRALP
jgi:hypothetical protein